MVFNCLISLAVISFILAVWVLVDGLRRGSWPLIWVLGTFVLGPIILPMYRARRPLLAGEARSGGPDWIVARNFSWVWSIYILVATFWVIWFFASDSQAADTDTQQAVWVNRILVLCFLGLCWVVPAIGGLFLSLVLRDPDEASINDDMETESSSD